MKSVLIPAVCLAALLGGCATEHRHAGHSGYQEIALDRAPDTVRAGVQRDYPDADIRHVGREFYDKEGTAHFHVVLTAADGKRHSVEYDEKGTKVGSH